ncbi:UTP--glucose-1-phosphate uridylyltransferase [Paenibacillus swuensis]|uniref:UTP--glucose-1-phosphate uridylyltransferase n=1 Tax=Paenibacillus swuensis TaxID=1178515 RepID=A0A172TKG8_9BACL|nr:UTP--glucose-1-phosphate uridylyltransferase GalU [Paenibacillus swuensis]ANE47466.1 UTP--glucose-1-phosphate uridylyltransferase [Paenibacillus swuensis]
MKIRKAIIPAAGLGTRFLPATKAQPKEMLPIVDKPAIQYIVEEAISSGIEDIIIVTGKNKRAIEDHFDKSFELEYILEEKRNYEMLEIVRGISSMVDIHYIRQKEQLGLGHAVLCAMSFIGDEPFAVLLGDDIIDSGTPCLKQMMDVYDSHHASVIAVQEVAAEEVHQYGVVAPDRPLTGKGQTSYISDLVEKPERGSAPSNFAVIGRYVIQPQIFEILERQQPGRGGEIQLTDALRTLNENQPILAYSFEGKRYDTGNKFGYIEATIEFALQRPELSEQLRSYLLKLTKDWKIEA